MLLYWINGISKKENYAALVRWRKQRIFIRKIVAHCQKQTSWIGRKIEKKLIRISSMVKKS